MDRNISDSIIKSVAGWSMTDVEKAYTKQLSLPTLKMVCNIL